MRPFLRALLSIATLLASSAPVFAEDKTPAIHWMAAARNSATVQWGRLVLHDGMLTFHTATGEWKTPLSEIKRVARVKGVDRTFEIVTSTGAALQLSILGPLLLPEPPQKAMEIIERAARTAPAPVVTVTTDFRVRH